MITSGPVQTEVPRSVIPDLVRQLGHEAVQNPFLIGFAIPATGYAEVTVNDGTRLPDTAARLIFRNEGDDTECVHKDAARMLPSVPYRAGSERRYKGKAWSEINRMPTSRIHVARSAEGPCIEISNASPLAMFLFEVEFLTEWRPLLTIKIDYGTALNRDVIFAKADALLRSFLYELDVRNGAILSLDNRPQPTDQVAAFRSVSRTTTKIRYPETPIQYEAAELFHFASQARDASRTRDNPLLAFLSYYQVLEYFLPAAATKDM